MLAACCSYSIPVYIRRCSDACRLLLIYPYIFMYDGVYHTATPVIAFTTKRVPVPTPNGTSSESSRLEIFPTLTSFAPTLLTLFQLLLWRYRPWKIGPGGCDIHRRIRYMYTRYQVSYTGIRICKNALIPRTIVYLPVYVHRYICIACSYHYFGY